MTTLSETTLPSIAGRLPVPAYLRDTIRTGIVHFGVGGFHRSHQAMFIDRLLNLGSSREWGICGVGVLPVDERMRDVLYAQDGLYTLILRNTDGSEDSRVIGSIIEYLYAPDNPTAVIDKLLYPATRIVSLSITEGGYGIDDATGEFLPLAPDIVHDLAPNAVPTSVFGFITAALAKRREQDMTPFTVMSCDNIQGNGDAARKALLSFARLKDPGLADWINTFVAFPNSMVDRITPATTDEDREAAAQRHGFTDAWPVIAEPFAQWVLEDTFTSDRPPLQDVGVQLVDQVAPYELMKLRLLNASHQVMSHLGYLAGYSHVHEVCTDPAFSAFVLSYMEAEATPTLPPVPGVDLSAYRHELLHRFSNTAIRDTLARQMVDTSDRIPKFLLPVVREQLRIGGPVDHCALVVAAWVRVLELAADQDCTDHLADRRLPQLLAAVCADREDPGAFLRLHEVFGDLGGNATFVAAYVSARELLRHSGARAAVEALANHTCPTQTPTPILQKVAP